MVQHAPATSVDISNSRPYLNVGVSTQVFHQEINQPAVSLQQGEHLYRAIGRIGGNKRRSRLGCSRRRGGGGLQRERQPSIEENGEEGRKGELHTSPEVHQTIVTSGFELRTVGFGRL
jgi:hypothetical protein